MHKGSAPMPRVLQGTSRYLDLYHSMPGDQQAKICTTWLLTRGLVHMVSCFQTPPWWLPWSWPLEGSLHHFHSCEVCTRLTGLTRAKLDTALQRNRPQAARRELSSASRRLDAGLAAVLHLHHDRALAAAGQGMRSARLPTRERSATACSVRS
jgi:hypothetical protein